MTNTVFALGDNLVPEESIVQHYKSSIYDWCTVQMALDQTAERFNLSISFVKYVLRKHNVNYSS